MPKQILKLLWFCADTLGQHLVKTLTPYSQTIDHFTVVFLVAWPLNENEAGDDLVLIETSLLFLCKFLLISMRTASLE